MKYILAIGLIFSLKVSAVTNFQNIDQLLDHIESTSPEIQKAKLNLEVVKGQVVQAGQVPNPELIIGHWAGRADSQKWKQDDYTILQPVELGGKRKSRMAVAEALIKSRQVELSSLAAETRLKVLFNMYRLRQVNEEYELILEAKNTFQERAKRSPKQIVFALIRNDYELLLEDVKEEQNLLEVEMKIMTGLNLKDLTPLLPQRLKVWPKKEDLQKLNAPTLKQLSAQVELSESELKLAKADVWPTVSIGPSFTAQNQFGGQANIMGFMISMPIPVWNQNDGTRAIAAKSMVANKKLYEVEKNALEIRREGLFKTYVSSAEVLERQMSENFLQKNKDSASGYVIELQRQIVDNQRLLHARELKTLDAYYQLVLLEGGRVEGIKKAP